MKSLKWIAAIMMFACLLSFGMVSVASGEPSQEAYTPTPEEEALISVSEEFWSAMENADEEGMRAIADPDCTFVHIGMTCGLDTEVMCYTSGLFQPTEMVYNSRTASIFGSTGIVITDCNYTLLLGGRETTHHFAVTEVYAAEDDGWTLVQFSFTALEY